MMLLEAENITKRFSNHLALDKASISVPRGNIFGLLGPNGAGKTTLIRIINMITAPDEGTLTFNGRPLRRSDLGNIGYLPEERGLYKKMKVGEQSLYLAQLKGLSKQEAMKRLRYWFERLEITSWWNKKVEELSKGMQQKVQFVITIIHEPELLIFDEPFSGFDPINTEILKKELLGLRDKGATIVFSTHNMGSVEELCDRIALINKSRVVLQGEVQEIRKNYSTNSFLVEYSGDKNLTEILDGRFRILEDVPVNSHKSARIQIAGNAQPNELLNILVSEVRIHSFQEKLPTMNEIFIHKVTEE
jgi:ABC-2 type transport system ATP-binding protein